LYVAGEGLAGFVEATQGEVIQTQKAHGHLVLGCYFHSCRESLFSLLVLARLVETAPELEVELRVAGRDFQGEAVGGSGLFSLSLPGLYFEPENERHIRRAIH
jgi:hypothetical protein